MRHHSLFAWACDALPLAVWLLSGCGSLWTDYSHPDPDNCVRDSTVCTVGQHCNVRLQACEADVVLFPTPVAPPSYISPGGLVSGLTYPRDVHYTLATPLPAILYYTLDGSAPQAGQPTTVSGPSPLPLGPLPGGTVVHWYADYGPPYVPETLRTFTATTDQTPPDNFGSITENLQFVDSSGPVVITSQGAHLTLTINFQGWSSTAAGSCPDCPLKWVLSIPNVGPVLCLDNVQTAGSYPGQPFTLFGTINTPLPPGHYPLVAGLTTSLFCDPADGPEIGEVFVQ